MAYILENINGFLILLLKQSYALLSPLTSMDAEGYNSA